MEDLEHFRYNLEAELSSLHRALRDGTYQHGPYHTFTVRDPKRREIAVASVRDRLVHRLLYSKLTACFDRSFAENVWSARKGKGLTGAIARAERCVRRNRSGWLWRGDIRKFFDHVQHGTLFHLLQRRVRDEGTLRLLAQVIGSYSLRSRESGGGVLVSVFPSGTSRARFLPTSTCRNLIALFCIY